MLDKNGNRMLCYVTTIDNILPIEGYDRVEQAIVGGWRIIVSKADNFQPGDKCIYFEIDSLVDAQDERFEFLEKRKYRIKTQRMCKTISQGLVMPLSLFPELGDPEVGTDLTEKLNVKYYVPEDNKRKANGVNKKAKYQSMASRYPHIFKKKPVRWLMRREWCRKLMFLFFGRKRDKGTAWPSHIAAKTDVERIQNEIWVLQDKTPYVVTEKVDGSSCSVMAERKRFGKIKYYVCSRNVVFQDENQKCFYDENIYFEMYHKYDMREILTKILEDYNLKNVAIQFEIFGPNVQKNDYSLSEREGRVFHIVSNREKFPMDKVVEICEKYGLPHVPIIDDNYILPDTIEEVQAFVESEESKISGKMKEGAVFYDKATGQKYFKFVSPEYLMKFH